MLGQPVQLSQRLELVRADSTGCFVRELRAHPYVVLIVGLKQGVPLNDCQVCNTYRRTC